MLATAPGKASSQSGPRSWTKGHSAKYKAGDKLEHESEWSIQEINYSVGLRSIQKRPEMELETSSHTVWNRLGLKAQG